MAGRTPLGGNVRRAGPRNVEECPGGPVREYSTPPTMEAPTTGNLTDDVVANAREHGADEVFSRPGADGWESVTATQFHDEVRAAAKGLIAAGIEAGDRIALICKTRYEWTL